MTEQHGGGFARLVGRWQTRGVVVDAGEQEDVTIVGTDSYRWLGERFVVHETDVEVGGRRQQAVEVFELDGESFRATAWTSDGSVETVSGSFDADGVYRAGNTDERTTLRVGDETMSARWERSTPDGWVPWLDMGFRRAAPPDQH